MKHPQFQTKDKLLYIPWNIHPFVSLICNVIILTTFFINGCSAVSPGGVMSSVICHWNFTLPPPPTPPNPTPPTTPLWWRHQMEAFSALLALCAGNSPVTGEFPSQRPVMRSFDVFFDLRLNGRFSKQSWGWWFETPSRPLWRHSNDHPKGQAWFSLTA